MRALSTPTLLKRLPPGVWLVVIWCASTTYALVAPLHLDVSAFFLLTGPSDAMREDLLLSLVLLLLAVSPRRRPLRAFALVQASSLLVTMAIPSTANAFPQYLPTEVALCYLAARVGLLHGEFAAGPRPGGGFRVAALLPLPAAAPAMAAAAAVAR
jgi:hypothetical protein